MSERTEKGKIVFEALKKDKGKTPNQTLAKLLFAQYPGVFDSAEDVRCKIRYYTGNNGPTNKKKIGKNIIPKEPHTPEQLRDRFYFPSDAAVIDDFVLKPGKWGIVGDIHYPYHDTNSLETTLEYFYKNGITNLLLNGDSIDFYEASDFEKDRSKRSLKDELYGFRDEMLPVLIKHFAKIVYKVGNHERRWTRYLRKQAPAVFGFEEFRLNNILRFDEANIGFVDNTQKIKAGNLDIWHGHELRGGIFIPVNPARSAMVKYKGNIVVNHHHRTSFEPMQMANETAYGAWSIGALCHLRPEYYPTAHTVWNHGFGELELDPSGEFQFENMRIIKGKVRHS